jgi:hypothetical protein
MYSTAINSLFIPHLNGMDMFLHIVYLCVPNTCQKEQ